TAPLLLWIFNHPFEGNSDRRTAKPVGSRSRVRDRSGNPTESGRVAGANEELQRIARPPQGGHAQTLFFFFLLFLMEGRVCGEGVWGG
ncbi:MAG: hypothetical protein LBI58_03310, partial [Tannerellaceae bacterium]|nr:hypothetical protein [Tannerellaceae bacterium]